MTGFKDHWDDKANKSRNHHVGHHGHKDDDAQIRIAIHVGNNKGRKDATDHTIHKAHENAFQDAFFIAMKLDVPNGNAANDHSQVWVAAFPPIPATMGMEAARATT